MAIYQGDIGIHDIKLGSIDVFEIYQGSKLVYPENTEITITFKLNVSGTVTINGYTPVISENNTKFVFTIPVKTDYTANITAEHYKSQTISGNSGYLPITHNVELEWEQRFISYTVTFPTDGVKVLFDGIEKGVITNGKLVVLIDDTEAKDSYTVTFKGSKASIYDTSTLTVVDSAIANTGGSYDLKLPTSSVKSGYKRTDYASPTGSITKGSTYAGTWIETIVNLTASFTSSTTLGSISNNVLTIPNNESTNTKSGTLTVIFTLENKQTKEVSAALNQAAGAKVYTNWVLDLQTDGTSVEAKGGTRTITANVARRTYKWNNTGTVYSETATPTLSISGSATLSGNQIKFTSNESVSARSATLTASYVGLSKTVTITQQAGAKVYSAWSAWAVSISASTQTITASGGSATITTSASRSRTWTWNGVGTTHTETETATPTLSGSAGGFTLSGKTVTASNNTTTNSRSITITATSNSVSKSITITQSAGAKVYGNWSSWTVNISADKTSIGATGGTATISTSASRTRSYTWNGVAGSGGTETGNGSPTLSKVSGTGNWTSPKVTYGNNTSTSGKSTVIRATIDSTTKDITINQSAGAKQYSAWSAWTVNISNSGNVAASGGSSNITTSASRTRTWTWNGVSGSGGTETGTGTPTLSKISGAGSFASNKVTYDNNTSTSARSTVIRATMDSVTKDTTVTQNAGSKTYSSWGAWSINLSANVTTIAAAGGNATLSASATRSRTWQWNGTGTTYTENASGAPTLSKVNGAASLSGSTVSYGNNTSTSSRSSVFRATIDSVTKDITINQSAGAKVYGSWSSWSVSCSASSYKVWAGGDSVTIYSSASRNRTWTWNGVAGSGGTESDSATPTISVTSGVGVLSGNTLTFSNNTSPDARTTRVTANYNGVTDYCDVMQYGGNKVTGSWTSWQVTISASPMNIVASGGSSTITCSAVRTRNYTWNGVGTTYTETENGSPTLSKSGDGTLSGTTSGSKLTYGNRTTTTSRSTTVTATYNGVSKSINVTQSAGAKSYGAKVYHTKYYGTNPDGSGLDFTGYPYTNEIDTVADANTISISVYYRLYTTQLWTWNGVAGSGGTETVYYNPDDVNVTNKVNCDVSVANAFNYASMIIITFKLSANNSDTAREYKIEWNWLNHNIITKGTQRANPMRGRLVIKNDYFTSQNIALPIYLDSENVDSIYKGEASYNDIKKTPIGVYVYIPTNISIMNAGKLQFWFENKDGGGSKYTCTLSSVSTPSNNVSVSNSNNIISVTANTTTSSFTILCQFTMTSNSTVFNVRVLIEP
ncbi:putative Bacon domain containing protein [CrAssphage sp. C0526BW15]|nr:putative Bacon domain containing protein [CrAssphage sp. C0526BW15]